MGTRHERTVHRGNGRMADSHVERPPESRSARGMQIEIGCAVTHRTPPGAARLQNGAHSKCYGRGDPGPRTPCSRGVQRCSPSEHAWRVLVKGTSRVRTAERRRSWAFIPEEWKLCSHEPLRVDGLSSFSHNNQKLETVPALPRANG